MALNAKAAKTASRRAERSLTLTPLLVAPVSDVSRQTAPPPQPNTWRR